ncbi:MAG: hypothetical protein NTZ49_04190 [Candidatus Parcubacteria bacterium]|nr:hypothetical protein [Candidatus Parcubacteria bacterium]
MAGQSQPKFAVVPAKFLSEGSPSPCGAGLRRTKAAQDGRC